MACLSRMTSLTFLSAEETGKDRWIVVRTGESWPGKEAKPLTGLTFSWGDESERYMIPATEKAKSQGPGSHRRNAGSRTCHRLQETLWSPKSYSCLVPYRGAVFCIPNGLRCLLLFLYLLIASSACYHPSLRSPPGSPLTRSEKCPVPTLEATLPGLGLSPCNQVFRREWGELLPALECKVSLYGEHCPPPRQLLELSPPNDTVHHWISPVARGFVPLLC